MRQMCLSPTAAQFAASIGGLQSTNDALTSGFSLIGAVSTNASFEECHLNECHFEECLYANSWRSSENQPMTCCFVGAVGGANTSTLEVAQQ